MEHEQEIEATQHAFSQVIRRERQRLANGFKMRDYLAEQLASGVYPDHYRITWIEDGVTSVINHLRDLAIRFDEEHPNDKVSAHDFVDVLRSAIGTLATRSGA